MKKNRTMRTAALLLALTLMTSCFVGGTFAKYATADSAQDTARVAKFGVVVTASGNDAFAEAYGTDDKAFTPGDDGQYDAATVVAAAETTVDGETTRDKVVAPGTTGSFGGLSITGTPEVDVTMTIASALTIGEGWYVTVQKVDDTGNAVTDAEGNPVTETKFYCPLNVTDGTTVVNGADYLGNKDGFIADVQGLFAISSEKKTTEGTTTTEYTYSKAYAANTNLAEEFAAVNVTWTWPYNGADVYDTELGDRAAEGTADMTIKFSISASVEQVN